MNQMYLSQILLSNFITSYTEYYLLIFWIYIHQHKTQSETRCSTKSETREYIRTWWILEDFLPEDLKSTKVLQPYILSDPEFTFIEKFLEKRE